MLALLQYSAFLTPFPISLLFAFHCLVSVAAGQVTRVCVLRNHSHNTSLHEETSGTDRTADNTTVLSRSQLKGNMYTVDTTLTFKPVNRKVYL